jgi:hypothetical protein
MDRKTRKSGCVDARRPGNGVSSDSIGLEAA